MLAVGAAVVAVVGVENALVRNAAHNVICITAFAIVDAVVGRRFSMMNETFEQWLKGRDERFGVRDISDVEAVANAQGMQLSEIVDMPANNFSLVFHKREAAA